MSKTDREAVRARLRGVIPPLCTLLTPQGDLWPAAQQQLLDFVAPHMDGLFVSGTTGLCPWLSMQQQVELLRHTHACLAARALDRPVLCGALGNTARGVAARAQALAEAGADAAVVYTPYFFRHTHEELRAFFVEVAARAEGVPLVLYNLPQMTQNDITPELAAEIVDAAPSYVAIKDSKGDAAQFERLLPLRDRLNVLAGDEGICRQVLGRSDGCVPAAANVFPLLWRRIMDEAGDADARARHHEDIVFVKRDLYGLPDMPQVISGILTALHRLGIGAGPVAPLLPVGRDLAARIEAALGRLRAYVPEPFRSRASAC